IKNNSASNMQKYKNSLSASNAPNFSQSTARQSCSGVEDIKPLERKSSYVAITVDSANDDIEEFDHLDELIIYLVSFLRRLRKTYILLKGSEDKN
ncbi:hypothetical protein X975_18664, partial [Stegodyphus mimosarum]